MTKGTDFQRRLRAASLSQTDLAMMLGVAINTISRQVGGALALPGYVLAFVTAWEMLTCEQRDELRAKLAETSRP